MYVCVLGWGVHFYDGIPFQTFNGELCLTISILQITQWRFGELCPMRVLNLALKMTAWYYTVFLWHQHKLRNFLEGWFWLGVKCKLKVFGWVWLKRSYKPSLLGIAQRLWDGPWVEREEEMPLQTMALGHSSKHNSSWKKIFGAGHSNLFFKKLFKAPFGLRRQQNVNAANVLREQPLSCNGYVPTIFMPILLKV